MIRSRAEVALSLGVVALGVGVAAVTATLPSEGGYAGIGPNFIPAVVAGGIILLGLWLSFEAFTGGWRKRDGAERRLRAQSISVGQRRPLRAHAAHRLGRLRRRRDRAFRLRGAWLRQPATAHATSRSASSLALGIFLFFVKLLNVNLPAGWLAPLLGGAGI